MEISSGYVKPCVIREGNYLKRASVSPQAFHFQKSWITFDYLVRSQFDPSRRIWYVITVAIIVQTPPSQSSDFVESLVRLKTEWNTTRSYHHQLFSGGFYRLVLTSPSP